MKKLIEKAKALFFLDTEKEEVSFAVAMHLESVIRYIEEMQQASTDEQYYDYVKIPKRQWQRLLNAINFDANELRY